jgi:rRNA maturation RNase YbeY
LTKINLENCYKGLKLPSRRIKKLVKTLIEGENLNYDEINYIFVTDREIHKINEKFLNHSYPTDVIAFDLSDEMIELGRTAEIYISIDRAIEQAERYKVKFENELARLIIHGLLHLAGYDDQGRKERERMRRRENYYLRKLKF